MAGRNGSPNRQRGGPRTGTPGKAYSNRTDLNTSATQPIKAATGQPYGEAGVQIAAQHALPLPQTPPPGSLPPLTGPTQRPGEPLTSGLPTGPGAGPEALAAPPNPLLKAAAILNTLGDTADADTKALRALVNTSLNNQSAA